MVGMGGPLQDVATRHGAATTQIALAWLLARAPNMVPIPGTASIEHLEENMAARAIWLEERDLRELQSVDVPQSAN